jgi:hypothetical protein
VTIWAAAGEGVCGQIKGFIKGGDPATPVRVRVYRVAAGFKITPDFNNRFSLPHTAVTES